MAIDFLILNKNLTPYIYLLFFSFFVSPFYGQENNNYSLIIKSKDSLESNVVKSINYKSNFKKIEQLHKTKDSILTLLKEKGYYTLLTDSINQQKKKYTYYLKLGLRIKSIYIKVDVKDAKILQALNLKPKNEYLILENEKLKPLLNTIQKYLTENGQLFSKVKLINLNTNKQSLFTELQISYSKKRSINKTILNGYTDFPSSFIKHYLNLNTQGVVNETKIEEISRKINQLNFASEIKKPEILFSKDSTILYLYLRKKKASSFDGLINFSTENKKLNFRGYLDLNLVNIFNKGEEIKINWKNNSNNKQDFILKTKIPYIFNSKISTEAAFNLYRSDSTYTTTNSKILLSYPINQLTAFSFLFSTENSNVNSTANNISNFDKKMIGLGMRHNSQKNNKLSVDFNILYGIRNTNVKTKQFLVNYTASGLIKTSNKTTLFIRNKSGLLFSDFYLNNELFREGGVNSIRGFNEQSIFTSKFSYINSEFRFISKNNSYLYSIHDIGVFNSNTQNNVLYSFGIGYNYIKNNNSINVSYTRGESNHIISNLLSSFLSINYLTLF
ncbi:hypothetical protein KCTC32516_00234 [Polaribacter huanghezhanensis]|uniref:hypothetical protein n=1 Tax=Polaribacter huanghezhanensis TaxID=1354726 RepID=UPI00264795F6|nr:hypothetical protein [Polaribacter huanghezhanensis]WKD84898.1 hypothetical protein KCTC32516_00234 [Polaribacter huanghezhanensis]